jgi:hypothetical protein
MDVTIATLGALVLVAAAVRIIRNSQVRPAWPTHHRRS